MDGPLPGSIDTVVIGAGQAGLLMSWHLQQAGRDHVVVDRRETLGGGWQDRWDGFRLVGPNWTTEMPGYPYDRPDRDGFMTRDEVAARMRRYADVIDAPVHRATEVTRLTGERARGRRFHLETSSGPIDTDDVIVATGAFQIPKIPAEPTPVQDSIEATTDDTLSVVDDRSAVMPASADQREARTGTDSARGGPTEPAGGEPRTKSPTRNARRGTRPAMPSWEDVLLGGQSRSPSTR